MDCSPVHQQQSIGADAGSDYGSDFTAEEEELVNQLLAKVPSEDDAPSTPVVDEFEDVEEPGPAKMPRILGRDQRSRSGIPVAQFKGNRASVQIDGNIGATNGKPDLPALHTRLTDFKASS